MLTMEDYSQSTDHSFCAYCFRSGPQNLQRCSRCKSVFYCSPGTCQSKNWGWHKPHCTLTASTTSSLSSSSSPRRARLQRFLSWSRSPTVSEALMDAGLAASLHMDPRPKFQNDAITVIVKETSSPSTTDSGTYSVLSTSLLPFNRVAKSLSNGKGEKEAEVTSVLKNIVARDMELGAKNEWFVTVMILVNEQKKIVGGNIAPMCKPKGKEWIKDLTLMDRERLTKNWKDALKTALEQAVRNV
ncbi:hypothetical protein BT69DRAFT_1359082 [Atractiella rhizophila]|nr:hypothetical protein BT69DRAFT_1359082 [Atractiella rhizophila]